MSMNIGGDSDPTLCEINVTPMVDVMLVLLVIFMVTAPLMQQGVEVDLPKVSAKPVETEQEKNLILSITKDKKIFIGQTEVLREELATKLTANEKIKKDKEIFLQADRTIPYGFVVDIMATLKDAGIEQLNMMTDPSEKKE
jgi:biopolymer transport protein TolR